MSTPLIRLRGVRRHYGEGEARTEVLKGIDLDIHAGEFVVIVGASGSGKSTLMNILGCLDLPSAGEYRLAGIDVNALSAEARSALRRETFGFIFQRYHLLGSLSAAENVEMPALYAGAHRPDRRERAARLLARLGLKGREHHRPAQLSGGQQQRVSIARALVNQPRVILADEPTGALDSASGQAVMATLHALHREGHTLILITHDPRIARDAPRRIEIEDGRIVADERRPAGTAFDGPTDFQPRLVSPSRWRLLPEILRLSFKALAAHRLRTALTLLGIVIGVGSVVAMMGIGHGARERVVEEIQAMGAQLIRVRVGSPRFPGSRAEIRSLTWEDGLAIAELPGVAAVIPETRRSVVLRAGNRDRIADAVGTGAAFPFVRDWPLAQGSFFDASHEQRHAPVAVLGAAAAEWLFPDRDPIGEYLLVDRSPFRVIGVLERKGLSSGSGRDYDEQVWVPHTTAGSRIFGQTWLNELVVKAEAGTDLWALEQRIFDLVLERHRVEDFHTRNQMVELQAAENTSRTFNLLLGAIAVVSLLVGGIGVMNIMLVSVTERTGEIGIRMAVGAPPASVRQQFLTEAVVVCLLGGVIGVLLGLGGGQLAAALSGWRMVVSPEPILLAFGCAFLTGLVFGYWPARRAASLSPVEALNRE